MRRYAPPEHKGIPASAKCVFQGVLYGVHQWEQEMFDGSLETFEMLDRADTVLVIAVKDDKIVVSREQQPFIGSFCGVPGGRHDHAQEDELAAAKRELAEEAGLICASWKLVHVIQPNRKIDQLVYIFLASDVREHVAQKLDVGEKITVEYYDFESFKNMSASGEFCDRLDILDGVFSLDELLHLPDLYDQA